MKLFPKKNEVVNNRLMLHDFYREWADALPVLLAQEVISGPDSYSWVCSCTYNRNSDLLDCLVRQKLRTIPAHFGTSTYSVSRRNDDVVDLARKLGKKLDYVGHAGIEFRWDDRDERYKYIELNPRIGGEIGFDEACGLPTVWNSYTVALGGDAVHSNSIQANNIYFVDLRRDIVSLRADRTPVIKIFTIHFSLLFKRTSGLHFSWDDPMPGLVVAFRAVKIGVQKVYEKLVGRISRLKQRTV
jgi:predicted ATP-grasp superfamily ATP-dependent carboligase